MDSNVIKQLLSTWDQPSKCSDLFRELSLPTPPAEPETFIIKHDVSDCNPQITEVMQDFSLINREKERDESDSRDISQYFRQDIKELLSTPAKSGMQRTGGMPNLHSRANLHESQSSYRK